MGIACSRRSRPLLPPLRVVRHIPAAARLRARRRWHRAIRRVVLYIRIRKIWASLGVYLNRHRTSALFNHLRRRNGILSRTGSRN